MYSKEFGSVLFLWVILFLNSSCKEEVVKQEEEPVRNLTDISYSAFGQEQVLHPFEKDSFLYVVLPSSWTADSLYYIDSIQSDGQVRILHSELPSIFISTESGSMDAVDNSADKSVKEKGYIRIVNADGSVEYDGKLKHIKGRGNSTWRDKKKPYNIKLKEKAQVFGFRKSKSFCLLANALETCPIGNSLTYSFAKDLGMPYSIGTQQVALWLNGNYQGLYLLTEKVGAGKAGANLKVQPDSIDGGVILESIPILGSPKQCISSTLDGFYELKDPDSISQCQLEHIQRKYQELEEAVCTKDGVNPVTGKHYSDYLDVASFAKYYLLQELFVNDDALLGSYYFYKNADDIDSLFYAGPLWDMDRTVFSNGFRAYSSPIIFYAKNRNLVFFPRLCNQPRFWESVKTIYREKASPLLSLYFDVKIDSMVEEISADADINNIRWSRNIVLQEELKEIKDFMHKRIEFLDKVFSEDSTTYHSVLINRGYQDYAWRQPVTFLVESGDTVKISELNKTLDGYRYLGCFNQDGTLFDFRTSIYEDKQLYMRWEHTSWIKRVKADVDEFRVNFGAWRRSLFE